MIFKTSQEKLRYEDILEKYQLIENMIKSSVNGSGYCVVHCDGLCEEDFVLLRQKFASRGMGVNMVGSKLYIKTQVEISSLFSYIEELETTIKDLEKELTDYKSELRYDSRYTLETGIPREGEIVTFKFRSDYGVDNERF